MILLHDSPILTMIRFLHLLAACLALAEGIAALPAPALSAEPQPDPNRGLYAIWAKPDALQLPFIRGGQICLQWADVQPEENKYDFSQLDKLLSETQELRRPVTVQINGNRHPAFLFGKVPHHPERLSVQVSDRQGTLQYWHPAYVKAYLSLVAAYGRHLRSSPYRDCVLGVRLNFNAIGTEHLQVPKPQADPAQWICPPGVEPGPPWSRETAEAYKRQVLEAFSKHFAPEVRVLVRNNAVQDPHLDPQLRQQLETGQLGLFHTSSEVEPRSKGTQSQYRAFLEYCRPGKTVAYAEPWADAWGRHGGQTDPRWCSPPQWNYWRLLIDLHCGVSCIAIYGADLAHAREGEFRAAFEFAARYAGYHASPSLAPGAWLALREGNFLQGDYTFLMTRLDGDATRPLSKVGPDDQRFGAWARLVPQGGRVRFAMDSRFVRSLEGRSVTIRVIYLDDAHGSFTARAAGRQLVTRMQASGRWKSAEFSVDGQALQADRSGAHVSVHPETDLTLHMVEVTRGK